MSVGANAYTYCIGRSFSIHIYSFSLSMSLSVARRRCFFSSFDVRYNVYTRVHIYILYIYTEAHAVQTPVTYTVRRAVDGYCCARFSMEYRGKR